jgi:hypothetical protein
MGSPEEGVQPFWPGYAFGHGARGTGKRDAAGKEAKGQPFLPKGKSFARIVMD